MNETAIRNALLDLIKEVINAHAMGDAEEMGEAAADFPAAEGVETFEEAGIVTHEKGLVLRMADGAEYQITIVRSR